MNYFCLYIINKPDPCNGKDVIISMLVFLELRNNVSIFAKGIGIN